MDREYAEQLQRLQQFRRGLEGEQDKVSPTIKTVPVDPKATEGEGEDVISGLVTSSSIERRTLRDPLIYPGIYAPSGFDMMDILIRVRTRPNPVIDLGHIDSSVALVLCDLDAPDTPIVYCSESFEHLTGYSGAEIIGRNCRFLQRQRRRVSRSSSSSATTGGIGAEGEAEDKDEDEDEDEDEVMVEGELELDGQGKDVNAAAKATLTAKTARGEEAQVQLVNYKKNGERFVNVLTTVPISWAEGEGRDSVTRRYVVGFQVDSKACFP